MNEFLKPPVDPNVVALLENALADARAGRLIGIAMVGVLGPGRPAVHIVGTGAMEMNIGCDAVKVQLVGQVLKPSPLMRVS